MTAPPKIEGCPFCGVECSVGESLGWWNVSCWKCPYISGVRGHSAEAVAAHNRIALAARLFPEAVRLLREVSYPGDDFDPSEWCDKRDALLSEAQEVADAE